MKKIILLLLALTVFKSLNGHVTKDSFEKAIDFLNCYSVFYSLSVLSITDGVTRKFLETCDCESNPTFEEIKKSISSSEKETIEISNEIEILKNSYNLKLDNSIDSKLLLIELFGNSNILKKFKDQLIQKNKYSDFERKFDNKLEQILLENNKVRSVSQKELISETPKKKDSNSILEKKHNSMNDESGLIGGGLSDYIMIIAIILGILIMVFSFAWDDFGKFFSWILGINRIKSILFSNRYSTKKDNELNNFYVSEIEKLKEKIRELEYKVLELQEEINKMNRIVSLGNNYQNRRQSEFNTDTLSNIPSSKESTVNKNYTSESYFSNQIDKPLEQKSNVFFLSTPNSEGSFNESSASNNYRDGASIYKFVKLNSGFASFQIDEKLTSIKLALQYPDKNIDPVCDAQNAFNPNANKISTIKLGEAELQNGKWIINSKAVIRYED